MTARFGRLLLFAAVPLGFVAGSLAWLASTEGALRWLAAASRTGARARTNQSRPQANTTPRRTTMETTRADLLSRGAKGGLALVAGGSVLVAGGSVLAMTNGRAFGSVDADTDTGKLNNADDLSPGTDQLLASSARRALPPGC